MKPLAVIAAGVFAAASIFLSAPIAQAASSLTECGIYEWVAPDAVTPGSITFGANSALGLAGDTTYVIAAGAVLPATFGQATGAPTCVALTLDGAGAVTAMTYVPHGTIRGRVVRIGDPVNDPGNVIYYSGGRIVSPAVVVNTYPGIAAVLVNAVTTGKQVEIGFDIDPDLGVPLAFSASVAFRGPVTVDGSDFHVDGATFPADIVDGPNSALLAQIAADGGSARVQIFSQGTISLTSGALDVTTDFDVVQVRNDPVTGAVVGPCGGLKYHGVFDNSSGRRSFSFRYQWVTNAGSHVIVKSVPKGSIYRTWSHRAKAGTYVRVSFWDAASGRWALIGSRQVGGADPTPCAYTPGYDAAL